MAKRLHGRNRSGGIADRRFLLFVFVLPVVALSVHDPLLGLSLLGGGAMAVMLLGCAGRSEEPDPMCPPGLSGHGECARAAQARDRMHEIEVEALEGKLAEMERRLEGARSEGIEMLALFDATEDADPEVWLRRLRDHLRIRETASQPAEPVALADVVVDHATQAGWRAGDVTIADSLPVVLAPPELLRAVVGGIFAGWDPVGPVTIRGRVDAGMAVITVDGLGLERWLRRESAGSVEYALSLVGGALLPEPGGVGFAVPMVAGRV